MTPLIPEIALGRMQDAAVKRLVIALSGGIDSISLLHAVAGLDLGKAVSAIHIDHGLQSASSAFADTCRHACDSLNVELFVERVSVAQAGSLETQARKARYEAFEAFLEPGDLLLLCHHADDQIETALFRLFRGSGLPGLDGMPVERPLGEGVLFRPLLDVTRADIEHYAQRQNLSWFEDPTNTDLMPDRNYIRHQVLPAIEDRWPGLRSNLRKAMLQDAEARQMLNELFLGELDQMRLSVDEVDLAELRKLDREHCLGVLRAWVMDLGLPLPRGALLEEVVVCIEASNLISVETRALELRQHAERLYLLRPLPAPDPTAFPLIPGSQQIPGGHLSNSTTKGKKKGTQLISEKGTGLISGEYQVRFRSGGEKLRIRHARSLKYLFQENNVPTWLRNRVPLIYQGEEFVAIPALPAWHTPQLVADGWVAPEGADSLAISFFTQDRLTAPDRED